MRAPNLREFVERPSPTEGEYIAISHRTIRITAYRRGSEGVAQKERPEDRKHNSSQLVGRYHPRHP